MAATCQQPQQPAAACLGAEGRAKKRAWSAWMERDARRGDVVVGKLTQRNNSRTATGAWSVWMEGEGHSAHVCAHRCCIRRAAAREEDEEESRSKAWFFTSERVAR